MRHFTLTVDWLRRIQVTVTGTRFCRLLRIVYTADRAYNMVKWRLMCAPYNGTTVIFLQFFVRQIESFNFTSSVRSGGLSVGHSNYADAAHSLWSLGPYMIKTSNTKMTSSQREYTLRASWKFDLESMSVSKPTLGLLSYMRSGFFALQTNLVSLYTRTPAELRLQWCRPRVDSSLTELASAVADSAHNYCFKRSNFYLFPGNFPERAIPPGKL